MEKWWQDIKEKANKALKEGTCPEGVILETLPSYSVVEKPSVSKFTAKKQTLSVTQNEGAYIYESGPEKVFSLNKFMEQDAKMRKIHGDFSESDFWSKSERIVYYGSDLPSKSENMRILNDSKIYQHIPEAKNEDILGICSPYVYIGQAGSFFPLHKVYLYEERIQMVCKSGKVSRLRLNISQTDSETFIQNNSKTSYDKIKSTFKVIQ